MAAQPLTGTMKIPVNAVISHAKLTEYLLAYRQKSDKSQFLAKAGFTQANPAELAQAIRHLIAEHEAIVDRRNEYGVFYRVEGELNGPDGALVVVTVWIQQEIDGVFRFVTLKPVR
jgi:hypothetical protein